MTPAEYFDRLLGGLALASSPSPRGAGEWDAWRALPLRTRRRIIGLGWARRCGYAPDQLAHALGDRWTPDELIAEMVRAANHAGAWRRERVHHGRRRFVARVHGLPLTYHQHRELVARQAGYRSYRDLRRARGWPG